MDTELTRTATTTARRQHLRWALVGTAVLALLSVFSGGFFLYAALVAGAVWVLSTALVASSILGLEIERQLDDDEIELG